MNWGKKATSVVKSYAQSQVTKAVGKWKAEANKLIRAGTWRTGVITSLARGTGFASIGGFKVSLSAKLRLPTISDIVNMAAGSGKSGEVLGIIQSMNSLKSAFRGSAGIAGLQINASITTRLDIDLSLSGVASKLATLGRQSNQVTNVSGVSGGIVDAVNAVTELEQTIASGGLKTTASSGNSTATKSFQTPTPVVRMASAFIIEIDGKPIEDNYASMVKRVTVHLTHEHRMSRVSILFDNDLLRFTNDPIWDEYKPIRVQMGYKTTGFKQIGGTFYSLGAKMMFGQGDGLAGSIELVGVSEEFMMGLGQERIVWNNLTDSQIVQQIAKKYGFLAAVQDTEPIWGQVSQMNQSDWDFLEERAEQYGYQLYIENSILHFHKPLFRDSGIKMVYYKGDDSQISGFSVWGEPLQEGNVVEGSQIDPLSGLAYTVSSQDTDDPLSQVGIGKFTTNAASYGTTSGVKRWADIVSYGGKKNQKYVYHSGRDPYVLQTEVQGFSENSRWVMKGMAKVVGVEWLRARDSIELAGVGRASGLYYMTDVYHRYERGIYTNEVLLTRTWKGGPGQSKVSNTPTQLVEVRE
jgi:hypothetical protein